MWISRLEEGTQRLVARGEGERKGEFRFQDEEKNPWPACSPFHPPADRRGPAVPAAQSHSHGQRDCRCLRLGNPSPAREPSLMQKAQETASAKSMSAKRPSSCPAGATPLSTCHRPVRWSQSATQLRCPRRYKQCPRRHSAHTAALGAPSDRCGGGVHAAGPAWRNVCQAVRCLVAWKSTPLTRTRSVTNLLHTLFALDCPSSSFVRLKLEGTRHCIDSTKCCRTFRTHPAAQSFAHPSSASTLPATWLLLHIARLFPG